MPSGKSYHCCSPSVKDAHFLFHAPVSLNHSCVDVFNGGMTGLWTKQKNVLKQIKERSKDKQYQMMHCTQNLPTYICLLIYISISVFFLFKVSVHSINSIIVSVSVSLISSVSVHPSNHLINTHQHSNLSKNMPRFCHQFKHSGPCQILLSLRALLCQYSY